MSRARLLSFAESPTAERFMTKTAAKEITRTIGQKRKQLAAIRGEVEDLLDYLDLVEARARDHGKPRLTHAEVKKRYGLE